MLVIEVPIPPRACHPNSRVHWTERAAAISAMRQWACYRAKQAMNQWESAVDPAVFTALRCAAITVQAHYSDYRRRDNDSLLASLKSAIDGIVDSGLLIDDDQIRYTVLPSVRDREKGLEGVTVTIRPLLPGAEARAVGDE